MGNGKEKKENDTLLYYIKGKFSGEDGKEWNEVNSSGMEWNEHLDRKSVV